MKLSQLARQLSQVCTLAPSQAGMHDQHEPDPVVRRACFDSRRIEQGDLYCALPGTQVDGRQFIDQAIERGAVAVLSIGGNLPLAVPALHVDLNSSVTQAAGLAAATLLDRPSSELLVAAVTGTNGKTTVVHLLQQAWQICGVPAARIGTLGYADSTDSSEATTTTPAADELHAWLAQARDGGSRAVALEASSHGIEQRRLAGCEIDMVGWTNLSHDHLDYHGDMQSYAQAKAGLVHSLPSEASVFLPTADSMIAQACQGARAECVGWSLDDHGAPLHARLRVSDADTSGIHMHVDGRFGAAEIHSPWVGRYNAENLLLAFGLLRVSGIEAEQAARALSQAVAAPGRLQRVMAGSAWHLFVDYAHTPEAIQRALQALREAYPQARIGIVVGAGGDRDPAKREPMGRAAAEGADWCMLTSDNPRTEDPAQILDAVVAGARNVHDNVFAEVDRRQAMRLAVQRLSEGDVLLVAGKGHESYQEVDGVRTPFDDCLELEEAVRCLN